MNIKKMVVTSIVGAMLGVIPLLIDNLQVSANEVGTTGNVEIPRILSDNNDGNLPEMTLSEALELGVTDVILTDVDVPEYANEMTAQKENMLPSMLFTRGKGYWNYKYTVQPYAFYQHTKTKKWKYVQVTSTMQHLINTVGGSWAGAPSWSLGISYKPGR